MTKRELSKNITSAFLSAAEKLYGIHSIDEAEGGRIDFILPTFDYNIMYTYARTGQEVLSNEYRTTIPGHKEKYRIGLGYEKRLQHLLNHMVNIQTALYNESK